MTLNRQSIHGEWSSRWAFVLAATGAAVGLGNIWKFPYIAGENGGGAFVIIYLICILVIGIPLMMAEIMLGRRGRQNPAATMASVAEESGASRHWGLVGGLGILAGFLILSYYSVIAGWALNYVFKAAAGDFTNASAQQIGALFSNLVASPWQLLFWHSIIMLTTMLVVARGVRQGLEKTIVFMFPIMLILLVILVAYSMSSGYFEQGLAFLFHPKFAQLSPEGTLDALGHAFFTLSLATGSIMMYGAYLPKNASITRASVAIAAADTGIALIAGLAIFPIVFANGLQPGAGPGLIFQTLPIAFGHMPMGRMFATFFFMMLVFAAFTSTLSLLEPSVAWCIERFHMSRVRATVIISSLIWLLGIGTVLSFNVWKNVHLFGMDVFDFMDYLTANIMLPLGGLLIVIFTAWFMRQEAKLDELQIKKGFIYYKWRLTMRYVAPVAILIVFLKFLGIF